MGTTTPACTATAGPGNSPSTAHRRCCTLLLAGLGDLDRARRIAATLLRPESLGGDPPLPSTARDDPGFLQPVLARAGLGADGLPGRAGPTPVWSRRAQPTDRAGLLRLFRREWTEHSHVRENYPVVAGEDVRLLAARSDGLMGWGGLLGYLAIHRRHLDGCNVSFRAAREDQQSLRESCKKGHFFTAIEDCDHVLFAYAEKALAGLRRSLEAFAAISKPTRATSTTFSTAGHPLTTRTASRWFDVAQSPVPFLRGRHLQVRVGAQGLMRIRAIYAADNAFRKLPPKRKEMRDAHVRPLIGSFFEWVSLRACDHRRAQPRHQSTPATPTRNMNCGASSTTVALPLDNTRSERSLRKIIASLVARTGCSTARLTRQESAAAIFSLVASCRLLHSIEPQQY